MRQAFRWMMTPILQTLSVRRHLVRFARFVTLESRLDGGGDDIRQNGEKHFLRGVIESTSREEHAEFFDVGANRGDWTTLAAGIADELGRPRVHVTAFEPTPETFEMLTAHLREEIRAERVRPIQGALSDTTGEATFHVIGPGNGRNSLTRTSSPVQQNVISVHCDTIDAFAEREGIREIRMLKIDAEGHDLAVMRGAKGMLGRRGIRFIQFEYNQLWIDARLYLRDAFELLMPLGYRIGKVTPLGIETYSQWHFELESWRQANYVAWLSSEACPIPTLRWWND